MGRKRGYRQDGTRIKRPDSKALARPKKLHVLSGAGSRALRAGGPLDRRTLAFKLQLAHVARLTAHLGGELSVPLQILVNQAATFHTLKALALAELERGGVFHNGEPRAALDAYRRIAADERVVLSMLGIERRQREVVDAAAEIALLNDAAEEVRSETQ